MSTNTQPSEPTEAELELVNTFRFARERYVLPAIRAHVAAAVAERDAEIAHLRTLCADRDYQHQRAIDSEAEVARLKANVGCAREQRSTQFCAEVVQRDKRITELENYIYALEQYMTIDALRQARSHYGVHPTERDKRIAELEELLGDIYGSTVDTPMYPDGPCIDKEYRQRINALLAKKGQP